jgi:hypothetical protein
MRRRSQGEREWTEKRTGMTEKQRRKEKQRYELRTAIEPIPRDTANKYHGINVADIPHNTDRRT